MIASTKQRQWQLVSEFPIYLFSMFIISSPVAVPSNCRCEDDMEASVPITWRLHPLPWCAVWGVGQNQAENQGSGGVRETTTQEQKSSHCWYQRREWIRLVEFSCKRRIFLSDDVGSSISISVLKARYKLLKHICCNQEGRISLLVFLQDKTWICNMKPFQQNSEYQHQFLIPQDLIILFLTYF